MIVPTDIGRLDSRQADPDDTARTSRTTWHEHLGLIVGGVLLGVIYWKLLRLQMLN